MGASKVGNDTKFHFAHTHMQDRRSGLQHLQSDNEIIYGKQNIVKSPAS